MFTEVLISKFNNTFHNTLSIMKNIYNMDVTTDGILDYDKYISNEELREKWSN
jgi:hypothetical protein